MIDYHKIGAKIKKFWYNLSPRERLLSTAFLALAFSLFVVQFGIIGNIKEIKRKNASIASLRKDLHKLNSLHEKYQTLKDKKRETKVATSKGNKSIISVIELYIQNSQMKGNVRYINGPTTITIKDKYEKKTMEVKVETVLINQILDFVYGIENSGNNLFVDYFFLRDAYNKPGFFDFTIRISQIVGK